jgi:hypothetical protein
MFWNTDFYDNDDFTDKSSAIITIMKIRVLIKVPKAHESIASAMSFRLAPPVLNWNTDFYDNYDFRTDHKLIITIIKISVPIKIAEGKFINCPGLQAGGTSH